MNATVFDPAWVGLTAPMTIAAVGGLLVLLLESFSRGRATIESGEALPRTSRSYLATVTVIVLLLGAFAEWRAWAGAETPQLIYHGMLVVDRWSVGLGLVFFLGSILSVLLAGGFMREHRFEFGEFYALVLFATTGMLMLAHASDLVSVFLGIETMSLAVYVLAGSWRRAAKSSEGAMKYFLVGAFASAIMLYGIALIYGASGSTSLYDLLQAGRAGRIGAGFVGDPIFLIGCFLLLAGLAFKIAAVPFHMWLPDAYEGAPTPVTAFMAAGVKAAGFAGLVRVLAVALGRPELTFGSTGWAQLMAVLAVLTMSVGNLAAIRQDNVKRLLAYSSIAHAGYLLVGVTAMGALGPNAGEARGAMLYYLASYTATTIGSFGVVAWFGSHGDERQHIDDWAGMASRHPAAALAMTVFLLSLGGFPPTAGFFGKFYIFRAALERPGLGWLVVVAVVNSMVSVFYYLRVVSAMYFREVGREPVTLQSPGTNAALILSAVFTLALGVIPSWFVELAQAATLYLPR